MSVSRVLITELMHSISNFRQRNRGCDFGATIYVSSEFYHELINDQGQFGCSPRPYADGTCRFHGEPLWVVPHDQHPAFKILVEEK